MIVMNDQNDRHDTNQKEQEQDQNKDQAPGQDQRGQGKASEKNLFLEFWGSVAFIILLVIGIICLRELVWPLIIGVGIIGLLAWFLWRSLRTEEFKFGEVDLSGISGLIGKIPGLICKPLVALLMLGGLYIAGRFALSPEMWNKVVVANLNLLKAGAILVLILSCFVGEGAKKFAKWAFGALIAGVVVAMLISIFGIPEVKIAWRDVGESLSQTLRSLGQWLSSVFEDAEKMEIEGFWNIALMAVVGFAILFFPVYLWKIAAQQDALSFMFAVVVLGVQAMVGFYAWHNWPIQEWIFKESSIRVPQGWALIGLFLLIYLVNLSWLREMSGKRREAGTSTNLGLTMLRALKWPAIILGVAALVYFGWPLVSQRLEGMKAQQEMKVIEKTQTFKKELDSIPSGSVVPVRFYSLLPEWPGGLKGGFPKLGEPSGIMKGDKVYVKFAIDPKTARADDCENETIYMRVLSAFDTDPRKIVVYVIRNKKAEIKIEQSGAWPQFAFAGDLKRSECLAGLYIDSFKVNGQERVDNLS